MMFGNRKSQQDHAKMQELLSMALQSDAGRLSKPTVSDRVADLRDRFIARGVSPATALAWATREIDMEGEAGQEERGAYLHEQGFETRAFRAMLDTTEGTP